MEFSRLVAEGDSSLLQLPSYIESETFADATGAPSGYKVQFNVFIAIIIVIAIIGLILGIVGSCVCVKPLLPKKEGGDAFDDEELDDLYAD